MCGVTMAGEYLPHMKPVETLVAHKIGRSVTCLFVNLDRSQFTSTHKLVIVSKVTVRVDNGSPIS